MGFSQAELSSLMPAIEDFAEIGEFFDQPIRVYSSGMQARLAFALATARRPDVLIVDEVLSVGDSYFQHKSFDKIRQLKDAGSSEERRVGKECVRKCRYRWRRVQ